MGVHIACETANAVPDCACTSGIAALSPATKHSQKQIRFASWRACVKRRLNRKCSRHPPDLQVARRIREHSRRRVIRAVKSKFVTQHATDVLCDNEVIGRDDSAEKTVELSFKLPANVGRLAMQLSWITVSCDRR